MKKFFTFAALALLSAGIAGAQDLEKATTLAKQANDALVAGLGKDAVGGFEAALKEAEACSDAADLIATCKQGIVASNWAYANQLIDQGLTKEAIDQLRTTIAVATAYENDEIIEKANTLKLQLHQRYANEKIKAAQASTDAAAKKACFEEAIANLDTLLVKDNTQASILITKASLLNSIGKKSEAIACCTEALQYDKDGASKQLSGFYVKDASALLKAGKYKEAAAAAAKSIEYAPSANAYKIAGIASQKAGDLKGAVAYLSKYLELKPGDTQISAAVSAIKAQIK